MKIDKKKIAVFDIDGTIFRSSLDNVLFRALIKEGLFPQSAFDEIFEYYEKWINRKGPYGDYNIKIYYALATHLKGLDVAQVESIACDAVHEYKERVYTYTRDLIEQLRDEYILLAISGSPIEVVQAFVDHRNFDAAYGTTYAQKNGKYTGEFHTEMYDLKKETLKTFCKEHDLTLKDSIGVGDTSGDISFLEDVENPIAFNPNQVLYEKAKEKGWKIIVERKDVIYEITP